AEEPGPAPTTLLPPLSPVMESSRPTEQLLRPPGVQAPPVSPMPEEPPLSPAAENYRRRIHARGGGLTPPLRRRLSPRVRVHRAVSVAHDQPLYARITTTEH